MEYVEYGYVRSGYVRLDSDTQGGFIFDGVGRKIIVAPGVTSISMPDMYSRWADWAVVDDNFKWAPALRYSGYDPIPGGFTGATFFVTNGWRVVYDPNTVAVSGVLYSDQDATAYWSPAGNPIYPATVAAVVNTSTSVQNVVTGTTAEIAAAVLALLQNNTIPVDMTKVKGQTINGVGTPANPWGP
jgi:hypothetical protein